MDLTGIPVEVMSKVLHDLEYKEAALFQKLDKNYRSLVMIEPCLANYVQDWSVSGFRSLYSMTARSCKLATVKKYSDIIYSDGPNKKIARKTEEVTRCIKLKCICKNFVTVGKAEYMFNPNMWKDIFMTDDLTAVEFLFASETIKSGLHIMDRERSCRELPAELHIGSCELNHINSVEMWHLIDEFTTQQKPRTFNVQKSAGQIYLHEKLVHQNFCRAEFTLENMIQIGVDPQQLAMEFKSNTEMLTALSEGMCSNMMSENKVIQQFKNPEVIATICCHDCVTTIAVNFEISVYHEMIERCPTELEDKMLEFFERTFTDADVEDRNDTNDEGATVLEVLYATRPLNRKLLVLFNRWKHDEVRFFT
jgi:hypothetical protein